MHADFSGKNRRRCLLIAFHYPPIYGSSGVQRTLAFSRYLPIDGWSPVVLTVSKNAFPHTDQRSLEVVPLEVPVYRAWTIDRDRHLLAAGRILRSIGHTERWSSWFPSGLAVGAHLIRKYRPDVIWSTYPIITAHAIAMRLAQHYSIPWIADFRDGMWDDGFPYEERRRQHFQTLESEFIGAASASIFTTEGTRTTYKTRYPHIDPASFNVIENGYDEYLFRGLTSTAFESTPVSRPIRIVHSGIVYPEERDPSQFFAALSSLKKRNAISKDDVVFVLRGSRHEDFLSEKIEQFDIGDLVSLEPLIGFNDALREMASSDGLLILQAKTCNTQIPAKIYEYLRLGKPILGLTDPEGDTGTLLRKIGISTVAPLENRTAIERQLEAYLDSIRQGVAPRAEPAVVQTYSREESARKLAKILRHVSTSKSHYQSRVSE